MKIISLFSGIGAFEKALTNLNIKHEIVGFSEIDKYAIKSYCAIHNVSEDKNLGDITKIEVDKLPQDIDLITHGSPCQDFSIAGKQQGAEVGSGTRSSLMWNTVEIVKHCRPKYIIWENVKNLLSAKHRHNFDNYIKIMEEFGYNNYYQVLNAKDYGIPQNRERVYTVSIRQGDCLELMKDIPDKSIDMILCDLPYGTTACKWDIVIPFDKLWEQYNRIIKPHGAIVLFGSQPFTSVMIASNVKKYKHSWIWNKNAGANFMNVKYMPFKVHEDIVVFSSGGKVNYYPQMTVGKERLKGGYHAKQTIYGDESKLENKPMQNNLYYPKSILTFSNADKNNKLHPTQKPVELLEYLIKTYTNKNETVLDNCMGSGSTGVACKNLNRNFIGIELDEQYFNIAKERIIKMEE